MSCPHSPSSDPRQTREDGSYSCVRCGKLIPPPLGRRNPQVEAEWFGRLSSMVRMAYGVDPEPFINRVQYRLEMGQKMYGDAYLEKCGFMEGMEETEDIPCYSVLEHQRLEADIAGGLDEEVAEEVRMDLLAAAMFATMANMHLRRGVNRHREAWIPRQAE